MNLAVETEQETDGRWIAEIPQIPGALAYGSDRREAISRVEALALRVLADRVEHGEMPKTFCLCRLIWGQPDQIGRESSAY